MVYFCLWTLGAVKSSRGKAGFPIYLAAASEKTSTIGWGCLEAGMGSESKAIFYSFVTSLASGSKEMKRWR